MGTDTRVAGPGPTMRAVSSRDATRISDRPSSDAAAALGIPRCMISRVGAVVSVEGPGGSDRGTPPNLVYARVASRLVTRTAPPHVTPRRATAAPPSNVDRRGIN